MGLITDPYDFVNDTTADADQVDLRFTRLYNAVNAGLDEANVPNLAAAFTTWKNEPVVFRAELTPAAAAGRYAMFTTLPFNQNVAYNATGAPWMNQVLYMSAADHNANARVTKARLRLMIAANGTAPAINYTAQLYNVTVLQGAANTVPSINTANAVGNSVTINNPAALGQSVTEGTEFNMPSTGFYVVNVTTNATPVTNSVAEIMVQVQYRQV